MEPLTPEELADYLWNSYGRAYPTSSAEDWLSDANYIIDRLAAAPTKEPRPGDFPVNMEGATLGPVVWRGNAARQPADPSGLREAEAFAQGYEQAKADAIAAVAATTRTDVLGGKAYGTVHEPTIEAAMRSIRDLKP
jgi:hypothetical protein